MVEHPVRVFLVSDKVKVMLHETIKINISDTAVTHKLYETIGPWPLGSLQLNPIYIYGDPLYITCTPL